MLASFFPQISFSCAQPKAQPQVQYLVAQRRLHCQPIQYGQQPVNLRQSLVTQSMKNINKVGDEDVDKRMILALFAVSVRKYKKLKKEMLPFLNQFQEEFGREPTRADVEQKGDEDLLEKYLDYKYQKYKVMMDIRQLRAQLEQLEAEQGGGIKFKKKKQKKKKLGGVNCNKVGLEPAEIAQRFKSVMNYKRSRDRQSSVKEAARELNKSLGQVETDLLGSSQDSKEKTQKDSRELPEDPLVSLSPRARLAYYNAMEYKKAKQKREASEKATSSTQQPLPSQANLSSLPTQPLQPTLSNLIENVTQEKADKMDKVAQLKGKAKSVAGSPLGKGKKGIQSALSRSKAGNSGGMWGQTAAGEFIVSTSSPTKTPTKVTGDEKGSAKIIRGNMSAFDPSYDPASEPRLVDLIKEPGARTLGGDEVTAAGSLKATQRSKATPEEGLGEPAQTQAERQAAQFDMAAAQPDLQAEENELKRDLIENTNDLMEELSL